MAFRSRQGLWNGPCCFQCDDKPVTVKTDRLGWAALSCGWKCPSCRSSGAAAIGMHGRTRVQMYEGSADWDVLKQVKQISRFPLWATAMSNPWRCQANVGRSRCRCSDDRTGSVRQSMDDPPHRNTWRQASYCQNQHREKNFDSETSFRTFGWSKGKNRFARISSTCCVLLKRYFAGSQSQSGN